MDKHEWIQHGIEKGWCTPPVCYTHDGIPMTVHEEKLFDLGFDPCVHIIRPYSSLQEKQEIMANHRPSIDNEDYYK